MNKWTDSNNPVVNGMVDSHIRLIRGRILEHCRPTSIIVSGSFGKGEGSVYLTGNNVLKYLSDYEIIIVQNRPLCKSSLKKLSDNLSKEIKADIGLYHNFVFKYTVSFLARLFYRKEFLPLSAYDRRYSCKIIYGADILNKLPELNSRNIPVWEGIRLILNRIAHALEHISYDDIINGPSEDKNKKYWIYRIILACVSALLIYDKRYHYSYKQRNKLFQKDFPNKFPTLYKKLSKFSALAEEASVYKLDPANQENTDIQALWFDVREICQEIFCFLIQNELEFKYSSYADFREKYISHLKVKKEFFRYISPQWHNLMNVFAMRRIKGIGGLFQKNPFRYLYHQEIYSFIPVLYFSALDKDGGVDEKSLEFLQSKLSESFFNAGEHRRDKCEYYEHIRRTVIVKLWKNLYM